MKNLHSRLGVLALALVLALGLCACGGENGVETASPAPVETPTETPTPTATPEPTAAPAPTSTPEPTPEPTRSATPEPTAPPSPEVTATSKPTATLKPTAKTTAAPSVQEPELPASAAEYDEFSGDWHDPMDDLPVGRAEDVYGYDGREHDTSEITVDGFSIDILDSNFANDWAAQYGFSW